MNMCALIINTILLLNCSVLHDCRLILICPSNQDDFPDIFREDPCNPCTLGVLALPRSKSVSHRRNVVFSPNGGTRAHCETCPLKTVLSYRNQRQTAMV